MAGGDVGTFVWAPDRSRIAYLADQDTDGVDELHTNLPDGSDNDRVSGLMIAGGEIATATAFDWSPDSQYIAFRADKETDQVTELFVTNAEGPAVPVKVSGPMLTPGGDVWDCAWSSDSTRTVYTADEHTDFVIELFTGGFGNKKISGDEVIAIWGGRRDLRTPLTPRVRTLGRVRGEPGGFLNPTGHVVE